MCLSLGACVHVLTTCVLGVVQARSPPQALPPTALRVVTMLVKKRAPRQVRCPYYRDYTHMRIYVYTNQLIFI